MNRGDDESTRNQQQVNAKPEEAEQSKVGGPALRYPPLPSLQQRGAAKRKRARNQNNAEQVKFAGSGQGEETCTQQQKQRELAELIDLPEEWIPPQ